MQQGFQSADNSADLLAQVQAAIASHTPLRPRGGGSKDFLGRAVDGVVLDTRSHSGIVSYDPTELVITARAGTPLSVLQAALDDAGQMLGCEPPSGNGAATVGGMVASGLSGPRRPWSGAVRDFVLGTRLITGRGTHLRFGGEVMKNVAGYDLSRLLAGSFGCLGLLTEVSLKVLPKPQCSHSLRLEVTFADALQKLAEWGRQALPVTGASHDGHALSVRLEGGEAMVEASRLRIGGDTLDGGYWAELRERRLPFFVDARPLWRLSLPPNTPPLLLPGDVLADWGGSQRWLLSDADAGTLQAFAAMHGGHATCYHAGCEQPFQPLAPVLMRYHRQLKAQMDPHGIFNPGRLYAGL